MKGLQNLRGIRYVPVVVRHSGHQLEPEFQKTKRKLIPPFTRELFAKHGFGSIKVRVIEGEVASATVQAMPDAKLEKALSSVTRVGRVHWSAAGQTFTKAIEAVMEKQDTRFTFCFGLDGFTCSSARFRQYANVVKPFWMLIRDRSTSKKDNQTFTTILSCLVDGFHYGLFYSKDFLREHPSPQIVELIKFWDALQSAKDAMAGKRRYKRRHRGII